MNIKNTNNPISLHLRTPQWRKLHYGIQIIRNGLHPAVKKTTNLKQSDISWDQPSNLYKPTTYIQDLHNYPEIHNYVHSEDAFDQSLKIRETSTKARATHSGSYAKSNPEENSLRRSSDSSHHQNRWRHWKRHANWHHLHRRQLPSKINHNLSMFQ